MFHPRFPALIAQAWAGMLVLLLMMFLVDLERHAMTGQYTELTAALTHDPGRAGLWVLVLLICLNVLMQMAVRSWDGPRFRRATLVLTLGYTTFFVLHQLMHWAGGEAWGLHTPLDITHHLLGAWGSWAAWCWCRAA